MTVYRNPFAMAQAQFDQAAQFLGLEPALAEFLRWPMREFKFTIPVRMDDGGMRIFHAYRIQYNHARGPCKGGLRWHPEETLDTGRALAAWMTWKTAVMDIPLGGSNGGIVCNSKKLSPGEKERLSRGYVRAMARDLGADIDLVGTDMYTTPQIMAWILDEFEAITGRSQPAVISGKPLSLGGSLGRSESIARGGVYAVREAGRALGIDPRGTFAIQGFGNTGQHVAILHGEILGGGALVAVSDTSGGVYNAAGLNPRELIEYKKTAGKVAGFPGGRPISNEDILELDVSVLYPASIEHIVTHENAERIQARILCELADGPTTPEADRILHVNGVHVIPDFLANAGGVIVSYFEQVQGLGNYNWSIEVIHRQLDHRLTQAYQTVYRMHKEQNVHMRLAAYLVALNRVAEAVKARGWV